MRLFGTPNIEKLQRKGDVEALIKASRNPDPEIRRAAVRALGETPELAVDELITRLTDDDGEVRKDAARALGRSGDRRAVDALISTLERDDHSVFVAAAEALSQLGDIRAVRPLLRSRRAYTVLAALVGFGPAALEELRAALQHGDLRERGNAIDVAKKLGDPMGTPLLISALQDPRMDRAEKTRGGVEVGGGLRELAATALGEIGTTEAADALFAVSSEDADQGLRAVAALALDRLGDPRAVDRVAELLLNSLGPAGSRAVGITHAGQISTSQQRELAEVLRRSADPRTTNVLAAVVKSGDAYFEARKVAVAALGEFGTPSAVDALIAALEGSNEIAKTAAEALGKLGDRRAVQPLIDIVLVTTGRLRERAQQDAGEEREFYFEMGKGEWVGTRFSFDEVRSAAAEALHHLGGPEAERALRQYHQEQRHPTGPSRDQAPPR